MATYAFSGAVAATAAIGQRHKVRFVGTWANGDTWTIRVTSTVTGDFTIGKGNIAGQSFLCALKLRNRMYLGFGSSFALSANGDVTLWEEQDPGAAVFAFLSQFGPQDGVKAFASIQGRLAVFGGLSTHIWAIDADPANIALQQVLDNTGTIGSDSVQSIGDLDVLYLDSTGIRSLRAKESTLNAFVNDIGTAIDLTIRAALVGYDPTQSCSIVEPATKQYWLYLNGNIYVLSNYPESKVTAWAIYKPTTEVAITPTVGVYTTVVGGVYYWTKAGGGTSLTCGSTVLTASGGFIATATTATEVGTPGTLKRVDTTFTPEKFVVYNRQVYVRSIDGKIYQYGGTDGNTYDACQVTVTLPWLDFKDPGKGKQLLGLDFAVKGEWTGYLGANPTGTPLQVITRGSQSAPDATADSTFDIGHVPAGGYGSHIECKMVSGINPTSAKIGKVVINYNLGTRR